MEFQLPCVQRVCVGVVPAGVRECARMRLCERVRACASVYVGVRARACVLVRVCSRVVCGRCVSV